MLSANLDHVAAYAATRSEGPATTSSASINDPLQGAVLAIPFTKAADPERREEVHADDSAQLYWIGPMLGSLLASGFYKFIKALEYETANPDQDASDDHMDVKRIVSNGTHAVPSAIATGATTSTHSSHDFAAPTAVNSPAPLRNQSFNRASVSPAMVIPTQTFAAEEHRTSYAAAPGTERADGRARRLNRGASYVV